MKKHLYILFFFGTSLLKAQDTTDLQEVTVSSYPGQHVLIRLPASVSKMDSIQVYQTGVQSGLPVLNSIAGVRMEERSPGSYRLSIRGSLLRSPFGIRNTKVYLDECPFTNAAGETYLNLLDFNCVQSIEVLKGPDGSLFGANSSGVLRIDPVRHRTDSSFANFSVYGGSFGLRGEYVNAQQRFTRSIMTLSQGWQQSEGYRDNSRFDRKYVHLSNRFNYFHGSQLRAFFLFSDLNYNTPGGLNLQQYTFQESRAGLEYGRRDTVSWFYCE
ncbi:MAG: TonB-dependent receptor [Bacteroidetes bacterium]|nr:TonB-dependent receptor [Bacteroidota bacterium]